MLRPFFRYSPYDAIVALCGVGIVTLILWTFLCFDQLTLWVLAPAFVAAMWSYCWNLQCISHNFIHNPFFTNPWLNRLFGVLETIALGVPHELYHVYHMNHHWGDNDAKDANGNTRDWSSIYRHSKDAAPESFWKYTFISYFRAEVGPVIRHVLRSGKGRIMQTAVESIVLGIFWLAMVWVNWRYFVYFYLPSYYLGWVLSYAEGYLEHYGAQPGNPYANSVSSYNRLYNFFWFNNGYHQEHHWDPKMHWTRMKELHAELRPQLDANHTRTLVGPHLTALLEDWFRRRGEKQAMSNASTKPVRRVA